MIRFLFSIALVAVSFNTFAQRGCPTPFGSQGEARKYHLSAGGGLTVLNGDKESPETAGKGFFVKGDYLLRKGLLVGVELQVGSLEAISSFADPREVKNNYFAGGVNLTMHPFDFFSDQSAYHKSVSQVLLDAFYVGIGFMHISNSYASIYRDMYYDDPNYVGPTPPENYGPVDHFTEEGDPVFKEKTSSLTLPSLNLGFAIPLNRKHSRTGNYWSFLLNSQFNFANNGLLDGYTPYDADYNETRVKKDRYSLYSLGLRFSF